MIERVTNVVNVGKKTNSVEEVTLNDIILDINATQALNARLRSMGLYIDALKNDNWNIVKIFLSENFDSNFNLYFFYKIN